MKHVLATAAAWATLLSANLAAACPVCAQRSEGGGALRSVALGVFIVAPWIVALTVGLYIRRDMRRSLVPASGSDSVLQGLRDSSTAASRKETTE